MFEGKQTRLRRPQMEASQFLLFPGNLLSSMYKHIPVCAVWILLRQAGSAFLQPNVYSERPLGLQGASATFSGLTGFTWKLTATSLSAVATRSLGFCPQWREPLAASQLPKKKSFRESRLVCACPL